MKKTENEELKNIFNELKNGNTCVIEDLYKNYNKMIYGIVFSILKNKDDSEDVVQTVFAKLHTIDSEKLPTEKEATWLYTVTKNEALMLCRKKNCNYDIEKIYDIENENDEITKLVDKESYNQLISKLNDKEKEIVSLKIISNLSFNEISKLLGEPVSTIKWRYYKSIYALKIMLSNLGMFILTFVLGMSTFVKTRKGTESLKQEAADNEIIKENESASGNFRDETTSNTTEKLEKDEMADKENQEGTILEQPVLEQTTNYIGYGILSISSLFLIITIIFAIILKKHQLNSKNKSSK